MVMPGGHPTYFSVSDVPGPHVIMSQVYLLRTFLDLRALNLVF
jgi:hypothetical protein